MKPAPRVLRALLSENWAIDPGWLPMLAAIAQCNTSAPELEAAREWVKRDHLAMAGGGAQKLAGAYRGFVVNGIGVLPITGPIFPRANLLTEMSGATSLAMLQNDHRIMLASKDVRAIMLLIDSPGGAVSGVADFASRVAFGAQRKDTRAYVAGAAASAGYWIASAASRISIDRTATLGSIGVVAAVPKQLGPGEDGYIDVDVVSSNAPNKRPDPQAEEGIAIIRGILDDIEKVFVSDVARGRKVSAAKVLQDFGQGGLKVGAAAVSAGMADRVESYSAAMNALQLALRSPSLARVGASSNHQRLEALSPDRQNQERLNRLRLEGLRRAR